MSHLVGRIRRRSWHGPRYKGSVDSSHSPERAPAASPLQGNLEQMPVEAGQVCHEARYGPEKILDELPGDGVTSAVFSIQIPGEPPLRRQGCGNHRPHVETLPVRTVDIPLDFQDQRASILLF